MLYVLGDFLSAYREIKQLRADERALKRIIGRDPDVALIQKAVLAVVAASRTDVMVVWTFPNGTKIEIKKPDALDILNRKALDPERAGAY